MQTTDNATGARRRIRTRASRFLVLAALIAAACGGATTEQQENAKPIPGQELGAAAGEMRSASYELSFQLGRGTLSASASGPANELQPAPITRMNDSKTEN